MADPTPDGSPGWTLGGIRKHGMRLEAACKTAGCGQFVVFDLDKLIVQVGENCPLPDGPGAELKFQLAVWHSDHEQRDE